MTGQGFNGEASLAAAKTAAKEAMPTIITAIVEQAKKGSCAHAKFLMEFVNESPATVDEEEEEESLAALLLKELEDDRAAAQSAG